MTWTDFGDARPLATRTTEVAVSPVLVNEVSVTFSVPESSLTCPVRSPSPCPSATPHPSAGDPSATASRLSGWYRRPTRPLVSPPGAALSPGQTASSLPVQS